MTPAIYKYHNHYFYRAQRRVKDDLSALLSPISAN